ncbi:MAG: hypothetical protein DWQ08_15235 [Proteobacteria bacterium]|nr:MAG: hypothetical protein DWQ08_15235 [Pseudomonadota bacterium]
MLTHWRAGSPAFRTNGSGEGVMLSFIYRLCRDFENEMGYPPNVLLINAAHLEKLRDSLGGEADFNVIRNRLGLEILQREDAVHPSVNWLTSASRRAG